jgi:hypothetical protein
MDLENILIQWYGRPVHQRPLIQMAELNAATLTEAVDDCGITRSIALCSVAALIAISASVISPRSTSEDDAVDLSSAVAVISLPINEGRFFPAKLDGPGAFPRKPGGQRPAQRTLPLVVIAVT